VVDRREGSEKAHETSQVARAAYLQTEREKSRRLLFQLRASDRFPLGKRDGQVPTCPADARGLKGSTRKGIFIAGLIIA
jgi:hypothetical protein